MQWVLLVAILIWLLMLTFWVANRLGHDSGIRSLEEPSSSDAALSGLFLAVPGMSRDEVIRELGVLNFRVRPGLFGENWVFESGHGETLYLNFRADDVLYLVTTGIRLDANGNTLSLRRRPLLSRAKLTWLMEREDVVGYLQSEGLSLASGSEDNEDEVFNKDGVDVRVVFTDEGLLQVVQLSLQGWENLLEPYVTRDASQQSDPDEAEKMATQPRRD